MEKDNRKIIALGKGSSGGGDAVWGSIGGTISNQTDLMTELNKKANTSSLSTVATSGDYNDLSNKPTIPDVVSGTNDGTNWTSITIGDTTKAIPNGGGVSQIQSDWNQSDNTQVDYIKNKPSIPDAVSGINDGTNWTSITIGSVTKNIPVAQVNSDWNASTGVSQILNKPTLGTMAAETASDYTKTSGLATVATSGSYNDLINTPSIPAAQIQSDWNQSDNTQVDYIKNKPSMSTETLTFVDANNVSTTVVVYTQPQI